MESKNDYASAEASVISRFSLAILGCLAIGIGIGSQIPFNIGGMAIGGGLVALAFYYYQNRRLVRQQMLQTESCRIAAEERLSLHVAKPEQAQQREAQAV